jgi:hypothetical protein
MMDQMAAIEGREALAVQQSEQPEARKFRDHDGIHQRRDNSHKGCVPAFVKHVFSFRF